MQGGPQGVQGMRPEMLRPMLEAQEAHNFSHTIKPVRANVFYSAFMILLCNHNVARCA